MNKLFDPVNTAAHLWYGQVTWAWFYRHFYQFCGRSKSLSNRIFCLFVISQRKLTSTLDFCNMDKILKSVLEHTWSRGSQLVIHGLFLVVQCVFTIFSNNFKISAYFSKLM